MIITFVRMRIDIDIEFLFLLSICIKEKNVFLSQKKGKVFWKILWNVFEGLKWKRVVIFNTFYGRELVPNHLFCYESSHYSGFSVSRQSFAQMFSLKTTTDIQNEKTLCFYRSSQSNALRYLSFHWIEYKWVVVCLQMSSESKMK